MFLENLTFDVSNVYILHVLVTYGTIRYLDTLLPSPSWLQLLFSQSPVDADVARVCAFLSFPLAEKKVEFFFLALHTKLPFF